MKLLIHLQRKLKKKQTQHHLIHFVKVAPGKVWRRKLFIWRSLHRKGDLSERSDIEAKRKTDTISHASLGRRHIFPFVASSANHAQNEGPWSGAGRSKWWRLPKWGGTRERGKLRNEERSTYLTARREPQGDIRGSAVFNIRPAGLRMKEGTLPRKSKTGLRCEIHHKVIQKWRLKDSRSYLKMHTSVFKCGTLKQCPDSADDLTLCLWMYHLAWCDSSTSTDI